jgi:hypothetical protein
MKFRKLRIAFSATCLVACVLLIVLWIRSYWRWESVVWGVTQTQGFSVCSQQGENTIQYLDYRELPPGMTVSIFKWKFESLSPHDRSLLPTIAEGFAGFFVEDTGNGFLVGIPYWFPVLLSAALAAAPWLPWWSKRFSLRTLLIATTLIAVVLGLIVWASRH